MTQAMTKYIRICFAAIFAALVALVAVPVTSTPVQQMLLAGGASDPPVSFTVSGGCTSTLDGTYTVVTCNSSGNFTLVSPATINVWYLVIGGGGSTAPQIDGGGA